MSRVTVLLGRKAIGVFDLTQERTLVGRRADADIPLDSRTVSRDHAELLKVGDSFLINNLSAMNGLFVNGNWVDTLHLEDGDEIEIDLYTLRFEEGQTTEDLDEVPVPPRPAKRRDDATAALSLDDLTEVRAKMKAIKETHLQQRDGGEVLYHALAGPRTTIGSGADCAIRIRGGWLGPKVSALIFQDPNGRVSVEAAGDKVPVLVNGELIARETPLVNGDFVEVGGTKFKFASQL